MNEEYKYNIGKYTIGADKGGEDGIGLTVAKIENDKTYVLGSYYGERAECIDLIIKENRKLKIKLQQKEDIINKIKDCVEEFLCSEYYCSQGLELHDFCVKILEILDNKGE